MKLFVDDIRDAPEGWTLARTITEAITLLRMYSLEITHVSLDHDISIPVKVGDLVRPYPSPETFRVVAYYMEQLILDEAGLMKDSVIITTHSANPEGRKAIVGIFSDIGIECEETPYPPATRAL
jgi:hypothetical protein